MALVGTSLIKRWASVIWLQSIEEKPHELMVMSMVRAHMCHQLATSMGCKNVDQFFTVGLMSFLDALLDRSMSTVLKDLPLVDPVKDALLHRTGILGSALKCVEYYELCDWENTTCGDLDEKKIREAYLNAIAWSRAVMNELVN